MDTSALVGAAAAHWRDLAAFAYNSSRSGPGAVVIHADDLTAGTQPTLAWFAAADVPAGDDFRSLMLQSDMDREVVLVIVTGQDDIAVVLSADASRPSPEECARSAET
ncbi:MAG: hypothetical protein MK101_09845 [Phycisphaerales bacterium]|nr:hypothetical protein [Phycisphaerales bacterium]